MDIDVSGAASTQQARQQEMDLITQPSEKGLSPLCLDCWATRPPSTPVWHSNEICLGLAEMGSEAESGVNSTTTSWILLSCGRKAVAPTHVQQQLSRLLHDYHRDLYNHLEEHEIGPSLYAAPWFLTVFASQFPLGFVARVFDMIFLQGSEVIFKVALGLLGSHKPLILQHENLETIVDFIKNTLPNLGLVQMEKTINQVFEMDISKQLQAYEVEYHVLQEELIDSSPLSDNQRMDKLEKTNSSLRKQNLDLLEQLQVANGRIQSLEATVEKLLTSESKLKQATLALELERSALLLTVEELRRQIAELSRAEPDLAQPMPPGD
nr:TBC1 domain family member 1-like [Dasypus novemcinctus]